VVIHYRPFGTTYKSQLVNKANLVHNLFSVYLSISTCFGRLRAHHQEKQLCLYYSVWMTVWYAGWNPPCIPDSHPYRITSTRCRINTVVPPDDGHIARNTYILINILRINTLRINGAPSWLYLQDYTGMHGQQNIKYRSHLLYSRPLKMGPIGCPETSVRNCHYQLRNNAEDRSSRQATSPSTRNNVARI